MNIIGEIVEHSKLGFGKICDCSNSNIGVEFFSDNTTKRFRYPICFESELRFCDPLAQQEFLCERGSAKIICNDEEF